MIAINLFECNFTTTIATCFPLFDAYQWMMYNLSVVMNPEKRAPSGEWIRQFFLKCGALHRKSHIFISHTNFDSVCVCALISFHCWLIHPYSFFLFWVTHCVSFVVHWPDFSFFRMSKNRFVEYSSEFVTRRKMVALHQKHFYHYSGLKRKNA